MTSINFTLDQKPPPKLPPEALARLWKWYHRYRSVKSRNKLAEHYSYVVRAVARRLSRLTPVDVNDLYQDGIIGLFEAIEKFDPKTGWVFATYAPYKIRYAMLDGIRGRDDLPRLIRQRARQMQQAEEALADKYSRPPTDREMQKFMKLEDDAFRRVREDGRTPKVTSLEQERYETTLGTRSLKDMLRCPDGDPTKSLENRDLLEKVLRGCSEQERGLLVGVYCEGKTQRQVATEIGLSPSRMSQVHSAVMARLREEVKGLATE